MYRIMALTCLGNTAIAVNPDVGVTSEEKLWIDDKESPPSNWRIA
jgi:hypothetical protein